MGNPFSYFNEKKRERAEEKRRKEQVDRLQQVAQDAEIFQKKACAANRYGPTIGVLLNLLKKEIYPDCYVKGADIEQSESKEAVWTIQRIDCKTDQNSRWDTECVTVKVSVALIFNDDYEAVSVQCTREQPHYDMVNQLTALTGEKWIEIPVEAQKFDLPMDVGQDVVQDLTDSPFYQRLLKALTDLHPQRE